MRCLCLSCEIYISNSIECLQVPQRGSRQPNTAYDSEEAAEGGVSYKLRGRLKNEIVTFRLLKIEKRYPKNTIIDGYRYLSIDKGSPQLPFSIAY